MTVTNDIVCALQVWYTTSTRTVAPAIMNAKNQDLKASPTNFFYEYSLQQTVLYSKFTNV